MRAYPDCYPCLVRHFLEAIQRATDQVDQQKVLINRELQKLADEALDVTPVWNRSISGLVTTLTLSTHPLYIIAI